MSKDNKLPSSIYRVVGHLIINAALCHEALSIISTLVVL